MALDAFCTTCQRTVYIEEGHTPVCPVCSSPLLKTIENEAPPPAEEDAGSAGRSEVRSA